jgi:hypothetical protein
MKDALRRHPDPKQACNGLPPYLGMPRMGNIIVDAWGGIAA